MSAMSAVAKTVLQSFVMPRSFLWRLETPDGCALTFDDGPHPEYTPKILDVLAREKVHGTFFVVGEAAAREPALLRRIVREGHALGSHTLTHREFPTLSLQELQKELDGCRELIENHCGVRTNLVRPPRGRINLRSLMHVARSGYRLVHWSKTYSDYLRDGVDPLLSRMHARRLMQRDIVLLHDTNDFTVEALSRILPEWRASGVRFERLGAS